MSTIFHIMKFRLLLKFVLSLTILVILPFGCSKKITDDNKNINVALTARLSSTEMVHLIDHARLTITSYSRNTTTTVELLINGNYLEGEISEVPAGENLFVAEAFNETGRVIYRGETKATVTADAIANIEFDLYPRVPLLKLSPRAVDIEIEQSFSLTAKIYFVENLGSISFRVSYDETTLKYFQ